MRNPGALRSDSFRSFLFNSLLALVFLQAQGQEYIRYTVSGFIKEAGSGESMIGVNVYLPDRKTGTVSNNFGFYSLTLPAADTVTINFSYVGFSVE